MTSRHCFIALPLMLMSAAAHGGVQEFTDKDEWINAVGPFTTVDFTGFDVGTFITDQYADLGILFTDGNDSIQHTASFVNDEWGLDGNGDISLAFDTPQLWIGVDFPGFLDIELYYQGELFHTGIFGFGGHGNFGGVLSDQPFDAAILICPLGEAEIDDLHFVPPAREAARGTSTVPAVSARPTCCRYWQVGVRAKAAQPTSTTTELSAHPICSPCSPTGGRVCRTDANPHILRQSKMRILANRR